MSNNQGQNLIFLISQPRAGSTLTQRIFGAHSLIHTQSEPWIMLHPLNALKSNNIHTAYDMDLYIKGARDFINHLPTKETSYRDIISEAYQSLYNSILAQNKKNLFLDKTPRYYYIIEELFEYFPNARFIFLWRNPAAVLTSIIQTWSKADWYRLSEWKDDLLLAPQLMLNGINQLKNKSFVLKYEDLLSNPDIQIKKACNFIGVPFDAKIINYGEFNIPDWQYGDQVTVNQKTRPDITHADTWLAHLHNPQIWRNVHDYMNYLGSELVSSMGYNFEEIENLLQENKPATDIISHTLPLSDLINTNRSILIENKRLKNDLKNANEGLKNKNESLRIRNEAIEQRDKLLGEKEKMIQQSKMEISKIQGILDEKQVVIEKMRLFISQKDSQIEHLKKLLCNIERSYTFRLGKLIIWPFATIRRLTGFKKLS